MQTTNLNQVFEVTIPGKVGIKKNSRRIFSNAGRNVSAPSRKYQAWESNAFPSVLMAKQDWGVRQPIDEPLFAFFEFHFLNRRSLPDTSNCIEGPQDLLESLGVYRNDQLIEHLEAVRLIGSKPKTIVRLFTEKVKA